MSWQYFVLGVVFWELIKALALSINRAVIDHRQKRFLKLVHVTFPENQKIAFIALDTSDKRAMRQLERQIREQYDPEPDVPDLDKR